MEIRQSKIFFLLVSNLSHMGKICSNFNRYLTKQPSSLHDFSFMIELQILLGC